MKNFDELYDMYVDGEELLYNELCDYDFDELIHECNKNISKYYGFREWLDDMRQYYE